MNSLNNPAGTSSLSSINGKSENLIIQLIATNNDRYEGYMNSVKETEDKDLKDLFTSLSVQSHRFVNELKKLVPSLNIQKTTSISENLYRVCIYVRSAIVKKDRCRVLSACEYGELMAITNYNKALADMEITEGIRRTLEEQKIHHSHAIDLIDQLNSVNSASY